MIPLRDSAAPRRLTPVNTALIAINVLVFVRELALGPRIGGFVARYALIPSRVSGAFYQLEGRAAPGAHHVLWPPLGIFTSMFVHGGIWHIAGNMLYLFIFGAAVECAMGARRYCAFYFVSGLAAAVATVAMAPESHVPVIGASGAIAGVLGAYFVLFPRGRILTVLPLFIFIQLIEVPAVLYLLLWFAVQLYAGLSEGSQGAIGGGVAWWAHVGGFLFGIALGPMLARAQPRRRRAR